MANVDQNDILHRHSSRYFKKCFGRLISTKGISRLDTRNVETLRSPPTLGLPHSDDYTYPSPSFPSDGIRQCTVGTESLKISILYKTKMKTLKSDIFEDNYLFLSKSN